MAKSQIGSLQDRKDRLIMESDTLRYQLELDATNLEASSRVFETGFQIARGIASIAAATAPRKKHKKASALGWFLKMMLRSKLRA